MNSKPSNRMAAMACHAIGQRDEAIQAANPPDGTKLPPRQAA